MITDERFEAFFRRKPLKKKPKVRTMTTRAIKEIIENDGVGRRGRDFGPILEELKDELLRRTLKESRELEKKLLHKADNYTLKLMSQGLTCKDCGAHASWDQIPQVFYAKKKKKETYHTSCKNCMKNKVKQRREISKIVVPF
jgi:hypothetical protein